MTDTTLETVLRRDRLVVAGALGVIAALAWGYVLWLAADMDMGGMDMTGFRMIPAGMGIMAPANAPWRGIEVAFVFAMWAVMMVGMMAPWAAPMILIYARGLRHGAYCVGCCWVLMALLFVGGVMTVLWIALLALLVLLEKLTPYGRSVARVAGIACVAAGAWLLLS